MFATFVIICVATVVLLSSNHRLQQYVGNSLLSQLSSDMGTSILVEEIGYHFPNQFSFSKLYIADLKKDSLLSAKDVRVYFDFWELIRQKLILDQIELNGLDIRLKTYANGQSNVDFILNQFSNKTNKKQAMSVSINSLKILESSFSYHDERYNSTTRQMAFDPNHLSFSNINLHLSVDFLDKDSLSAQIHRLGLKEQSGLSIKDLKTNIRGYKKGIYTPRIFLSLPASEIVIDRVSVQYDSIADFQNFNEKVHFNTEIKHSNISLNDFAAFSPNFKNLTEPINIRGKVQGKVQNIKLKNFQLSYGKHSLFEANIDLNGMPKIEEAFLYADIRHLRFNRMEMQDIIAGLLGRPFALPKELAQLGMIEYRGNLTGFFSNLVSYGTIRTQLGTMYTDISVQLENKLQDLGYNGTLKSNGFEIGKLVNNDELGKTSFEIKTNGYKRHNATLKGKIKGTISSLQLKKYNYQHIVLDGDYDGNGFDGHLTMNDPNGQIDFYGMLDLSHSLPLVNFGINVRNLNLHELNLTEKYKQSTLSFNGNINLIGNSIDDMKGVLVVDSILFQNNNKSIIINQLKFETDKKDTLTQIRLSSDIVNGKIYGKFNYSTILNTTTGFLKQYLPTLIREKQNKDMKRNDNLNIELDISDTNPLTTILGLPWGTKGKTKLRGFINSKSNKIDLKITSQILRIGKNKTKGIIVHLNNKKNQLDLSLKGNYLLPTDSLDINLTATAHSDQLQTQLTWKNNQQSTFDGMLQTSTSFKKDKAHNTTTIHTSILPTQMTFSDSIWQVKPAQIDYFNDSLIAIKNFKIQNHTQYLSLNGNVSKNKNQKLQAKLNDIEIGFLLQLIGFTPIDIDGRATGKIALYQLLQKPVFEGKLNVANVHLNKTHIGDGDIQTTWDNSNQKMYVSGIFKDGTHIALLANGNYDFKNDFIDFTFDTKDVNLAFLRKWLDKILKNVSGKGSGKLHMYGKSHEIGFQGNIFAKNASLIIDYLNTKYTFTDTIYLTPKNIEFKKITATDQEGNKGLVNGIITHNGHFQHMNYNIAISPNKMMALNTNNKHNSLFYGKAYASGNISIFGDEHNTNIEVNAKTEKKTNFNITVGNSTFATDNSFITFTQPTNTDQKILETNSQQHHKNNLNITLLMDVTPDAKIQLITNSKSGDMIAGSGNGNIRLEYNDKKDNIKLYGNYTIDKGYYTFTLQELIRKQFKIAQGSYINWSGDILQATLDLKATYSLTASLRDLMDLDIVSTGRTSVPVNCVLRLTDQLAHPTINFDIDLPSSDETLKMQVKNLINTQELLNRQIVYLLLFNKFYTPSYANASSFENNTDTGWTFLSSTLSGQLNNWLSKLSNNLTLGLNYRSSGYGQQVSQEYEAAVMLQPNSRLIVNGNIGYRDDLLAKNKIIGDVDVEYIFTENKKWRIKAYNHTIDRYSLRSAPFIQGVGIMYKKDFDTWRELWKKLLRKKQKDNTEKNNKNDTIQSKNVYEKTPTNHHTTTHSHQ